MADDEQARQEVLRRFPVWGWQSAPARKYALLVAHYYVRYYPFTRAGAECGPALHRYGGGLLAWVMMSADRPLSKPERASALACADRADRWASREVLHNAPIPRLDLHTATHHLRLALTDPVRAAAELVGSLGTGPAGEYEFLACVMECLWPAAWEPMEVWMPPGEVMERARRFHEEQDFSTLPLLADVLEAAGCPDRPLLDHCRNHPEHFRGCAALDRLLGADGVTPDQTDPLTGLANRRAFGVAVTEAAHRACAGRTPLSILALDLDGFRRINTSYGHLAGDRMLTEAAGLMRATLAGHLLARTGGDRFGALLRGHDLPAALQVAERLRRAVEEWRWSAPALGVGEESLTVSIGAAAIGPGSADDTFRAADDALHRAQAAGRNRVSD